MSGQTDINKPRDVCVHDLMNAIQRQIGLVMVILLCVVPLPSDIKHINSGYERSITLKLHKVHNSGVEFNF